MAGDTNGFGSFENNPADECLGHHRQIATAFANRLDKGVGGTASPPVFHGCQRIADAFLIQPVEIVAPWRALSHGGVVDNGVGQWRMIGLARDVKRAAGAPQIVLAQSVVLHRLEGARHLLPAPTGGAVGGPIVVILGLAAAIDQCH